MHELRESLFCLVLIGRISVSFVLFAYMVVSFFIRELRVSCSRHFLEWKMFHWASTSFFACTVKFFDVSGPFDRLVLFGIEDQFEVPIKRCRLMGERVVYNQVRLFCRDFGGNPSMFYAKVQCVTMQGWKVFYDGTENLCIVSPSFDRKRKSKKRKRKKSETTKPRACASAAKGSQMRALVQRLYCWMWFDEGLTRAAALYRILFVVVLWSKYGRQFTIWYSGTLWGFVLAFLFFGFTFTLLIGFRTRLFVVVIAVISVYGFHWIGVEEGVKFWIHHHTALLLVATVFLVFMPVGCSFFLDRWIVLRRVECFG